MLDVALRGFDIRVRIFFPALDREKEILLHFRPSVVYAVPHIHGRISRVQINFQRLIFDRDVGVPLILRSTSVTRSRNSSLPGAAVAKKSRSATNKQCESEPQIFHVGFLSMPVRRVSKPESRSDGFPAVRVTSTAAQAVVPCCCVCVTKHAERRMRMILQACF